MENTLVWIKLILLYASDMVVDVEVTVERGPRKAAPSRTGKKYSGT